MRRAIGGISARGPGFRVRGVPTTARGVSIPAPVGGLDAISPLAGMPGTSAVALDNMFPQAGYVEIRKGHARHNLITGGPAIESLMPYHALAAANDVLFAAGGTGVWDVTAAVTATVSVTSMGSMTNARFQHINMSTTGGNYLWICNGADAPRHFDGSAWATASVTGITGADIINVAVFKERIWVVLKDKISPAYLEPDAIAGTATMFDLGGVFNKGGFLQAIGTWSRDGGAGPDDYIAFITSRGEVAIYTGLNPASDFALQGVYEMGAPIGRRCLTKVGSDLAVVSIDGVLPLSRALVTDRAAAITETITKAIQPLLNQNARDYASNFGWQLIAYPRGTRAILNVPITENVQQQQYVMNTVTGGWGRFQGENANCWAVFKDRLFFGGNSGKVMEADCQGYDDDGDIEFNCETAFNYCGQQGQLKQFDMCRALLTTNGGASPGLALNVDFSRNAEVAAATFANTSLPLWDVDQWDQGVWPEIERIVTDWVSVAGIGYCASIRMAGRVTRPEGSDGSQELVLQLNGWDLLLRDGAFL